MKTYIAHGSTIDNKFSGFPRNGYNVSFSGGKIQSSYQAMRPTPAPSRQPVYQPQAYNGQTGQAAGGGGNSGGGGAKQPGGWYNGVQYMPEATAQGGGGGGGGGGDQGGGQQNWDSQLESIYGGLFSSLDQMAGNANTTYNEDVGGIEREYGTEVDRYGKQKQQLVGDVDTNEQRFFSTTSTAKDDAVRAYNALAQQAQSRFGRGSSAGQAVGELAQQEFFRQQGQIGQKEAQGAEDFGKERIKVNTYVEDQLNQLKNYKTTAMDKLKQSLRDQLQSIDSKKSELQSNKQRDKMNLLQQAVQAAQAMADTERSTRKQIAMNSLSQMQQLQNKTFTPAEIVAYLNEFENQFTNSGGIKGVATAAPKANYRYTGRQDELQGVSPFE